MHFESGLFLFLFSLEKILHCFTILKFRSLHTTFVVVEVLQVDLVRTGIPIFDHITELTGAVLAKEGLIVSVFE
jgi:hypothetical protein